MKCILLILLGWLILFSSNASAQHTAIALQEANQLYEEADQLFSEEKDSLALLKYKQAKSIYLKNEFIVPNLVDACLGIGILYELDEKFIQAIESYKESILYQKKITPRVDSSHFYPLVFIAGNFIELNQYDSSFAYYKQAEQILVRYPKIPTHQVLRFYNAMGYLFDLSGNYTQSINYFEKALKTLNYDANPDEKNTFRYVTYTNNIAGSLRKLGHYRKAININKNLIKFGISVNTLYQNITYAYIELNQLDSAYFYLNKIDYNDIPNSDKNNYYNTIGLVYSQKKQYSEALSSFHKAHEISLKNFGNKNGWLATAYAGKGQVYEAQNKYLEALAQYQLAIQALHFSFNSSAIYQNPIEFSHSLSPLLLFQTLKQKANAFQKYFEQTHKTPDLEASLHTYQLAFQLADRIRKGYDSDEAKLFFTNTVSPVYEEAIETAFQLYTQTKQKSYLEAAFTLAEQSKAAVLSESIRELEIRQVPGISKTLLQREKELKRNITALNLKLVETTDSIKKETYRDHIRDNEIELAKTLKEFEKNKPYYQLKYDTSLVKVSQIQTALDNETALVEYFAGKNNLYVFVITRNGFEAKRLSSQSAFVKEWEVLYQALYQAKPNGHYTGDEPAHRLYQQLISPVAASLAGKQRLLIIPDKELAYLPFEALVSDIEASRYLIQDYTISYGYSGKLLHTLPENRSNDGKISVLAMAPFTTHTQTETMSIRTDLLAPLYASADEIQQIGGKVQTYLSKDATKAHFLQQVNRHDIIHLATHAKADNQEPLNSFIAFYPNADSLSSYRLYAQELYNLRLDQLKLVVLSACETSNGKLVQGEGVMSLARAFAYAGCPSIVTTLWKAEDKTTADISTRMHAYLKAGKPKDVALRLAKLDYISSQKHPSRQSPVYWANFIFIGDKVPVYPDYTYLWWISGIAVTGLLALWLYRKRSQSKRLVMKKA